VGPPIVLETNVIVLEQIKPPVSAQALGLFAGTARRALGIKGEVNVRITSSRELQRLNRRFRGKDKPTDVLSFPSTVAKLAGDIAISADIAATNAADLGHAIETELKILILHGLLHLAGYDHETDNGNMLKREAKLRRQLKLPPGLIERTNFPRERSMGAPRSSGRKWQGGRP
jgi:probable rRNA maturation factor